MPNSTVLYFQGKNAQNNGMEIPFGDGLMCAGGQILRLGSKINAAGASHYPQQGDQPLSVRGMVAPGMVVNYQCWYRNAASFCTPQTFNLTNAVQVQWTP